MVNCRVAVLTSAPTPPPPPPLCSDRCCPLVAAAAVCRRGDSPDVLLEFARRAAQRPARGAAHHRPLPPLLTVAPPRCNCRQRREARTRGPSPPPTNRIARRRAISFYRVGGWISANWEGVGGGGEGREGGRVDALSGASDPCRAQCRRQRFCKCINLLSYAGESEQC